MPIEISIIILTYNCEDAIADNLKSLLSQNFPNSNYEIIIIDDFSKDNTRTIIEKIAYQQKKIKFYPLNHNYGNGYCKNFGLRLTSGRIVFFLDDHLYLKDNKTILKMFNYLKENSDIAGVCGNYICSKKDDYNTCRDIRRFMIYNKNNQSLILQPNKFIPFSIVISAINKDKLKDKLLFPEDFKKNAAEDVFFQIKQHEKGLKFAYMSNVIGIHDHSVTLQNLLIKSKRELSGFSFILEKMIDNQYFKTIFLPCFFSFPLLLWIFIILNFFIPWTIWFTIFFLSIEIIVLLPIFEFPTKFSIKLKAFFYCLLNEVGKIFYILKIIIKKPLKIIDILTHLTIWEFKKIIYIYENRFKKSSSHQIAITKQWSEI